MSSPTERMNSDQRNVCFEPPHCTPDEIDAVLSDGTHLKAAYQLEGRPSLASPSASKRRQSSWTHSRETR